MAARRFPWAAGERNNPDAQEVAKVLKILANCAKQARQYLKDGCYAPLGGLMQYIARDANRIKRSCGKLMTKYGR